MVIEHPTGQMEAVISARRAGNDAVEVLGGGTLRTARKILSGEVFIPARVWGGRGAAG